jgi:hypothetical protein
VDRRAEYISDFVKDNFLLSRVQLWPNGVERETEAFCLSNTLSSGRML